MVSWRIISVGNYDVLAKKLLNFYKQKNFKNKNLNAIKYLKRFDPIINSKKYSNLILKEYEKL